MSLTARSKAAVPIDRPAGDDDDVAWHRFWLGISVVLAFVIASTLLVIAVGGTKAGADYGLSILVISLFATLVDGIILFRRRKNR